MRHINQIVGALCMAASISLAANNPSPVIHLGYASYHGVYNSTSDTNEWYGIRYAQPPVGELRFREPQDIELKNNYSSSQPMNATGDGPKCVQGAPAWGSDDGGATGEEDCLLLNVLAPASANSSSNLPVMVQIHGGGYTLGSAESSPGDALVYQSEGTMIYVAIQYRLGAFGFLGGAQVAENGARNAGLLDQRAALMWVQRHISKFGGDSSKVTIIGGSAGGGSVMNQMILYGGVSNPPFRAVVSEYPWWQPFHNDSTLEKQYNLLLNATDCDTIECIRQVPTRELANAAQTTFVTGYENGYYGFGDYFYGPSVDGEFVRQLPSQEFKQGHFTKVPLFVNHDAYEGYYFSNQSLSTIEEQVNDVQTLFPDARHSFITRLFDLYPQADYNSTFFRRAKWFGDFIINCPTYYMATAASDWGSPVYKLRFAAGNELHGAIGPFVESEDLDGTGNNETLGNIMRDYYVSFAVASDPNAKTYTADVAHPYWPTYMNEQDRNYSVLDVTYSSIRVDRDADASPQCDFFHGQSYVVRN